jgi:hypothetical protein
VWGLDDGKRRCLVVSNIVAGLVVLAVDAEQGQWSSQGPGTHRRPKAQGWWWQRRQRRQYASCRELQLQCRGWPRGGRPRG